MLGRSECDISRYELSSAKRLTDSFSRNRLTAIERLDLATSCRRQVRIGIGDEMRMPILTFLLKPAAFYERG